jgi:EAL and modified HD-GYP domain-containing signal transduction protein
MSEKTQEPGDTHKGRPITPALVRVMNVLNLVSADADIDAVELEMRKDPALSLRLFQYIHSAGLALSTPIRSYRQAVMVIGYKPLYRWLSLLLLSAEREPRKRKLARSAAVRGRFMENVGREQLQRSKPDDLFVTGMFSLVHEIFDQPLPLLLETIQLPEEIQEALLSRGGVYGPLLQLAEAMEHDNQTDVARLVGELLLDPEATAAAHQAALDWTRQLGIGV